MALQHSVRASHKRSALMWIGGFIILALLVTVVGPYIYIHFINGPPAPNLKLTHASTSMTAVPAATASTSPASSLEGEWVAGSGSEVEYRVNEVLFGQSAVAVGTSSQISGSLAFSGSSVTSASFTVPMSTVHSNESLRDNQFDTRIMDVSMYPDASFQLSSPISLGSLPTVGAVANATATGNLTLHGTTRSVTFTVHVERNSTIVEANGNIPIVFSNWDIPNPSGGPAQVGNSGTLEFLLMLTKSTS